jgi:hypothetical protein
VVGAGAMLFQNVRAIIRPLGPGSSRSQLMITLSQRNCRHSEPAESEANSKISLRPGVIAFQHNVDLHSVQAEIETALFPESFYGIFIAFRRS